MATERLSQTVFDNLMERVHSQEFRPGDRLPPVHQLMDEYGVGRNTVREAMASLATLGIIEVRPRLGATVLSGAASTALPSATLSVLLAEKTVWDLYEARLVLEAAAAGMAAERSSGTGLEEIHRALTHFQVAYELGQPVWEADIEFHNAIARASGNSVFSVLLSPLSGLLTTARKATDSLPEARSRALREHREIADAISVGDADLARDAMTRHIQSGIWALKQLDPSGAPEA